MALKRNDNGTFVVRNLEDARTALETVMLLKAEVEELMKEHGITEMMDDAAEMKKAATAWAVTQRRNPTDEFKIQGDGFHATLIEQPYDARFIATENDLTGDEPDNRDVIPLRRTIRKKYGPFKKGSKSSRLWQRITKPVVMREALDEAVAEGLLSIEEVAPSFVEKRKAAYLRIFEDD